MHNKIYKEKLNINYKKKIILLLSEIKTIKFIVLIRLNIH